MPVFGTSAATLQRRRRHRPLPAPGRRCSTPHGLPLTHGVLPAADRQGRPTGAAAVIPPARARYLAEIADVGARLPRANGTSRPTRCGGCSSSRAVRAELAGDCRTSGGGCAVDDAAGQVADGQRCAASRTGPPSSSRTPATSRSSGSGTGSCAPRSTRESLSGNAIPRVALPRYDRPRGAAAVPARGEPAGVLPVHRRACSRSSARARTRPGCSPARATRSAPTGGSSCCPQDSQATRLSTAFDSVTLYGRDPGESPDVYGKVGTSGVSIATLEDMKALYDGFDLTAPDHVGVDDDQRARPRRSWRSSSNTAIDQQLDAFCRPRAARRRRSRRPRSGRGCWPPSAAPCRPTSSRRTRARTPASSRPSSACG